ncbi:MAG: hypothetical protein HDT14_05780 [Oscillibacter sp.]|nr:hypothetical protein [Oscillibacter sp.]
MKKQFIAKLLVLVMVLAMVPATALAVSAAGTSEGNNPYGNNPYSGNKDTSVFLPIDSNTSTAAAALGADKIAVEEGAAVINATVTDDVATVMLTDAAVKKLADAVVDGKITLVINGEDAGKINVCLPARALTSLAKKTSADLTIESSVATISISNDLITAKAGTSGIVKVTAEATENGVAASLWVNGKELKDAEGFQVNP